MAMVADGALATGPVGGALPSTSGEGGVGGHLLGGADGGGGSTGALTLTKTPPTTSALTAAKSSTAVTAAAAATATTATVNTNTTAAGPLMEYLVSALPDRGAHAVAVRLLGAMFVNETFMSGSVNGPGGAANGANVKSSGGVGGGVGGGGGGGYVRTLMTLCVGLVCAPVASRAKHLSRQGSLHQFPCLRVYQRDH